MERIFGAPQYYVQGAGCLENAAGHMRKLGVDGTVLAIVDPGVVDCVRPLFASMEAAGIPCETVVYRDTIHLSRIQALIDSLPRKYGCVLGVGGGRAIDVAKRVKWALGIRMIAVPTSIASDAAASRTAVAYNVCDEIAEDCPIYGPEGILVDTQVIVGAPLRLFAAGMADAISKRYEYDLSVKYHTKNWYDADPVFFLKGVAVEMHTFLMREARYLRDCFARHEVNETVEQAVTAMLLMSRLVYDSGGLRGAHDLWEEFHDAGYGHALMHGELVGFFDLVQLLLEGYPENEFEALYALYRELGIPLKVSAAGFDLRDQAKLDGLTKRMQAKCRKFNYDLPAAAFQSALWYLEERAGEQI